MGDIIDILEAAFRAKAAGKMMMPPKIFFHRHGPRFYSSMVSANPALGYAGCKWPRRRVCLLPGAKLADPGAARSSARRLAALQDIDAVLAGDGWPVFRHGAEALRELVDSFDAA